jgi:hypothetical protein
MLTGRAMLKELRQMNGFLHELRECGALSISRLLVGVERVHKTSAKKGIVKQFCKRFEEIVGNCFNLIAWLVFEVEHNTRDSASLLKNIRNQTHVLADGLRRFSSCYMPEVKGGTYM